MLSFLGGGRKNLLPKEFIDEEGYNGARSDGVNLIEQWKKIRESRGEKFEYVWNREELLSVANDTDYLLGKKSAKH